MAKTIVNTPKAPAKKATAKAASPAKPTQTLPKLKTVEVKPLGDNDFAVFIAGKQRVNSQGTKAEATQKAKAIKQNMAAQVQLFIEQNRPKAEAIELTNTLEF